MKREPWILGVMALAATAVSVHGLITETGVVGWINHLQQSVFGAYSLKVSLLISLFGLLVIGLTLWGGVAKLVGAGEGAGLASVEPLRAAANRPASARSLVWLWVGMIAAVWLIGFATHAWLSHQQRDDASASYERLVLADGVPFAPPKSSHLALRGDLLMNYAVAHSTGSGSSQHEDFQLLPLAAPGWQPGRPVNFIVKIRGAWELPGANSWPPPVRGSLRPPQDLMVRLDGGVPVPAAQQFKKMGVLLAEPSYLLHVVPSKDGQVDVKDSSGEDFQIMLYVCGGISVLLLIFGGVAALALKMRHRRLAASR